MALKPKVTVNSVKRKWEEKYAELDKKYEELCHAHVDLARQADAHRNSEEDLRKMLHTQLFPVLTDKIKLLGVIEYLECKLEDQRGTDDTV
jgi:hypothetical protein